MNLDHEMPSIKRTKNPKSEKRLGNIVCNLRQSFWY